jgi:hypothetical protein
MHAPVLYRSPLEDRFSSPAEVCSECSDFDAGMLVPVAFCAEANERCNQYYDWLSGHGPKPAWVEDPEIPGEPGPDAMVMRYPRRDQGECW